MALRLESFKYKPLRSRHIRLFGIEAGGADADITGTLIEQNLDAIDHDNNPFAALSYIWGDDLDKRAVIAVRESAAGHNGDLTITATLWNALRNFRSPSSTTWVWVDQISIDQSNEKEKGEQILLMRDIYHRATCVTALLENHDESEFAMDLLLGDEWSRIVPFSKALDTALSRLGHDPSSENRTSAFRAINSLLSQRYWKRTWIWQEVTAKPDDCLIRYGTKQVRLHNLILYIISYRQYMAADPTKDKSWDEQPIWDMTPFIDFWGVRKIGRQSSLLSLLDELRRTEITDPRDKIFAVLPFSSDAAQDIYPAYHRSAHEVYTQFVLWHVAKYQSLDVITFSKGDFGRFAVGHNKKGRITTKIGASPSNDDREPSDEFEKSVLATWVPDWRAKSPTLHSEKWKADRTVVPLAKSEHIYDPTLPRLYKASGTASPAFRFSFPEAPTFINGLTVNGVKVATIEHVQRDRLPGTTSLEVEEDWYGAFQKANVTNWNYAGDHLFKRTVYADVAFRSVDNIIRHARASSPDDELIWPHVTQVPDPLLQLGGLKHVTSNRAPFRTKVASESTSSLYGLGPTWARRGDEIWILKGASVPFVLRRGSWIHDSGSTNANLIMGSVENVIYHSGDTIFTFVGECFVLGIMDGEVLELMQLHEHDPQRSQLPELEQDFHSITLF